MIVSMFVDPWQEIFADAGDGDGGGQSFYLIPKKTRPQQRSNFEF